MFAPRVRHRGPRVAARRPERAQANGFMGQNVICQHHRMAIGIVTEMKADPGAFQLPAGKIQIRFPILHGVFQHRIFFGQPEFQRRCAKIGIFGKKLGQDLHHGLAVKDALIAPPPRQPAPWAQGDLVAMPVFRGPRPAGLGHDPIEMPVSVRPADADGGGRSQQFVRIERGIRRQRLDAIFEKRVQMIRAGKAKKHKHVVAQYRRQTAKAFDLAEGRIHGYSG